MTSGADATAFGDRFATLAQDCRAALDCLLATLPPGFIDRGPFERAWITHHRDGTIGTRGADQELSALLPSAEQWPALLPVCDLTPVPAPDLFLRTLTLEAYGRDRDRRIFESAAMLPYLGFNSVNDGQTCAEHAAADGRVARITAGVVPSFVDWRWACRCTVRQGSRRVFERDGLRLPD